MIVILTERLASDFSMLSERGGIKWSLRSRTKGQQRDVPYCHRVYIFINGSGKI